MCKAKKILIIILGTLFFTTQITAMESSRRALPSTYKNLSIIREIKSKYNGKNLYGLNIESTNNIVVLALIKDMIECMGYIKRKEIFYSFCDKLQKKICKLLEDKKLRDLHQIPCLEPKYFQEITTLTKFLDYMPARN